VIIPPQAAKQLVRMLTERIKDFEEKFGEIKFEEQNKNIIGFQN